MIMEKDAFVCVAVFSLPHESLILRARLDAEEIDYFVENENVISVQPFYSNAVGGIRIMVPEDQAEKALALISETEAIADDLKNEDENIDEKGDGNGDGSVFYENSEDFKQSFRIKMAILLVVVVFMFLTLWYLSKK